MKAILQHDKTSRFLFMCWFTYGDWIVTGSRGDRQVSRWQRMSCGLQMCSTNVLISLCDVSAHNSIFIMK